MFNTLYKKLVLVLLGLFFILAILLFTVNKISAEMYREEVTQKLNRNLANDLLADRNLIEKGIINQAELKAFFNMYMVINPNIEIYLLDSHGVILAESAPPGKVVRKQIDLHAIEQFLKPEARLPIAGDNPRDHEGQKIFSVAPIKRDNHLEGYLYVILGGDEYDNVAQLLEGSYIFKLSVWSGLAGFLIVLSVGLLLFALLTRRLERLNHSIQQFGESEFSQATTYPANNEIFHDEIDQLGQAFNKMSTKIIEQVQRLKDNDALRRELVANVSHDLRTPLASLQGYLETLLIKDNALSADEKAEYLQIAIKHSQRLNKLVSDLFELAKLDAHEIRPHCEPFALCDLLQDIIMKFKLQADKKQVTIEPHLDQPIEFVHADIGLVERALNNLIENALRYTPEGGRIRIDVNPQKQKIRVSVTDTGTGIPAEKLPYIFDRFYRYHTAPDTDSDSDHNGAGLGLAITKRIVELHGSQIEASSHPHQGTCISFYLPVHQAA